MEPCKREEARTDVKDDPRARDLLRRAFEKTARWQPDFKGFTADLTVNVNGKEIKGSATVKGPRDVTISLPDPDVQKWAENQIGMIAVHRGPRSFDESDGKYTLTLGDDADHPLGPKVSINGDGMHSFYRITGDRMTQINRKMSHPGMPPFAFTINVEDSMVTKDNKFLTTRYTVYYYSPQDGKLTNVESFSDSHVRVDASDLPASRRIIGYENGEVMVRSLTFANHKML
ncbi:MAG: DUF3386 family protein [Nitrospiraceae bacterium]